MKNDTRQHKFNKLFGISIFVCVGGSEVALRMRVMYHHRNITQGTVTWVGTSVFPRNSSHVASGLWLADLSQFWPLIGQFPSQGGPEPGNLIPRGQVWCGGLGRTWSSLGTWVSRDYREISLCQNIIGTWWDLRQGENDKWKEGQQHQVHTAFFTIKNIIYWGGRSYPVEA